MSWWRPRRPDPTEDELDAELRDHVERQVADHVRAGLSPRQARRRARIEFGGLDHVKEMCRDVRRARWIEDLGRDLRHALRRQFKDRRSGVPLFAVAALAIGIGASTAMFGVLDAVVLQPLPFAQEERLVAGWKIGVLPAGFVFPRGVDVFTALGTRPGLANNRTVFLQVVGRLRPGVSREQAAAEFDSIISRR